MVAPHPGRRSHHCLERDDDAHEEQETTEAKTDVQTAVTLSCRGTATRSGGADRRRLGSSSARHVCHTPAEPSMREPSNLILF